MADDRRTVGCECQLEMQHIEVGHGGCAMKSVFVATAALALSLVLATTASAQTVNTQAGGNNVGANTGAAAQQRSPTTGANTGPSGQDQFQATLPSVFQFNTRRAGIGPGGFSQLCDDPLDARLATGVQCGRHRAITPVDPCLLFRLTSEGRQAWPTRPRSAICYKAWTRHWQAL